MNVAFFVLILFFWSTSWIAIAWQAGDVPALVSIFYRFVFAGILFLVTLRFCGRLQPSSRRDHLFFMLQGLLLFCLNFVGFYLATRYIASGLVAVVMSGAIVLNGINARLFFGQPFSRKMAAATAFGLCGLGVVFFRDIVVTVDVNTIKGIVLAVLGTCSFSLGNMVSIRNSRNNIDLSTATAWAMCYGSLFTLVLIRIMGFSMVWDPSLRYVGALVFLVLGASIAGFSLYLRLLTRVGAARAAYVLVVTPVIALLISAAFEGYQWQMNNFYGLCLVMAGNIMLLRAKSE